MYKEQFMPTPDIKQAKHRSYKAKRSEYAQCGQLPIISMICGPKWHWEDNVMTEYDTGYVNMMF